MSTAPVECEELRDADKLWHLRQSPLMEGLSFQDLTAVANLCSDRVYAKGEVIFHPGDSASVLFILNRGSVRVSMERPGGKRKIVGLLKNGDVFGQDLLGLQEHHPVQATAHQESWVSLIPRQHLLELLVEQPVLSVNFIRILIQKLSEAQEDIAALSFLDAEHRVFKMLLKLARDHGKAILPNKGFTKVKIPLSHQQLARLIGANRPYISTVMSKLKKLGWVDYRKQKLLIDVETIQNTLESLDHRT